MQTIENARKTIDRVNNNFTEFLAKTIPLPPNTELKICVIAKNKAKQIIGAGKTPEDFMDMIDRVSQRLEDYGRENSLTYEKDDIEDTVDNLSNRYNALAPIAVHKDENGLKAYIAPRHNRVIDDAGDAALKHGANFDLARDLAKILADKSVEVQKLYLDNHTGPIAEILSR